MTPQKLRRLERIEKPNPKYANSVIKEHEVKEPKTYEDTSYNPTWQQAMEEEIIPLEQNQTWKLVQRLEDVKSTFCKWMYKIKCILDESIERYKAQHVARGFSQQYGLDYHETFSPIVKLNL